MIQGKAGTVASEKMPVMKVSHLSSILLGLCLVLAPAANGFAQTTAPLTEGERSAIYQALRHGPDATEAPK